MLELWNSEKFQDFMKLPSFHGHSMVTHHQTTGRSTMTGAAKSSSSTSTSTLSREGKLQLRAPSEISVVSLSDGSYFGLENRVWRSANTLVPKCIAHRKWVNPSTVKYYLPKSDRFVHVSETIGRHWLPSDRPNNMKVMNNAFRDCIEWVLVEPWMVQDNAVQRLAFGDFMSKTAQLGGLGSMITCFMFPSKRWLYWPLTSASFLGALAYCVFTLKDPISKYQVVKSPIHLTRFSIFSYRYELTVFRRTGNNRRIGRCSLALFALIQSTYFILYPPNPNPPCADCGLIVLGFLKDRGLKTLEALLDLEYVLV